MVIERARNHYFKLNKCETSKKVHCETMRFGGKWIPFGNFEEIRSKIYDQDDIEATTNCKEKMVST